MGSLSSIVVNITGDASGLNRALSSAQSKVRAAGKSMQKTGMNLTKWVSLPIAGIGAAALKTAADNEKAMQEIQAASRKTAEEMELIEQGMDDIRTTTGHSAQELQDAMTLAQSSTLDLKEANELVKTSAKSSAAGFGDMRSQVNLATSAKKKFGEEVGSASDVLRTLVGTADQVQAEMDKFVPSFLEGTGMMQEFNMSMDEGAALFGKLSSAARNTNAAGTQFKGLLGSLAKPQKDLKNLLQESFGSFENFRKEMQNNSVQALKDFKDATESSDKTLAQLLGRKRAVAGFNNLFAGGLDEVNTIMRKQSSRQDIIQKKFEQTDNILRTMAVAWEELKIAMRPLGEEIIPIVSSVLAQLVGHVKTAGKWFKSLSDRQQRFVVIAAGIAAAVGPALVVLGTLVVAVSSLINPIGLAVVAIGGLIAMFPKLRGAIMDAVQWTITNWPKIKNVIIQGINAVKPVIQFLAKLFKNVLVQAFDAAITSFKAVSNILTGNFKEAFIQAKNFVSRTINRITEVFGGLGTKIRKVVMSIAGWITGKVKGFMGAIRNTFNKVLNSIVKKFKQWKNTLMNTAKSLSMGLIGNSIIKSMLNSIGLEYDKMFKKTTKGTKQATNQQKKHWTGYRKTLSNVMNTTNKKVISATQQMTRGVARGLKQMLKGTKSFSEALKGIWDSLFDTIMNMLAQLIAKMAVVGAISAMMGGPAIGSLGGKGALGVIPGFQSGGRVPGRPGEPQLAIVHGGEQIKSRGESQTRGEKKVRDRGGRAERVEVELAGEPEMQALFQRFVDEMRLITGMDK